MYLYTNESGFKGRWMDGEVGVGVNLTVVQPMDPDVSSLVEWRGSEVRTQGFPEVAIALILKDVLSALTYIHSEHYVHGSVRAKHILLSPRKAVLSNFSYCQSFISQGEKKNVYIWINGWNRKRVVLDSTRSFISKPFWLH
uniref:MIP03308p n=1 Tax=Drosophila melanogaster TaxID=7227 RepID=B9EQY6_DROME|nr:MIP03308p [Drosophila melanogaster]